MNPPTEKKRGRPRAFDPQAVLEKATETFLRFGFSGASLDALTTAMGLNKPSLYAAFGDKRRLFQSVLEAVAAARTKRYAAALRRGDSLHRSLELLFEEAVVINTSEYEHPGCLIVSGSTTEALVDPELAEFTRVFFAKCDKDLASWIEKNYPPRGPVSALAISSLANGVIHDISLRARVGESRTRLREYARSSAACLARAYLA
jgi:AcrR family transcriptional regulator